jgi:transitional endoplasmic reticulum ATPase
MVSNFEPRIENGKFARDFTELRKIDGGSSGTVFKVREKRSRVVYAMKIMCFAPQDESKYEKKCANSTLALKFECDNLVKYHDVWREEKDDIYKLFIQMEFCEYTLENISDLINKNPELKINNFLSLEAMQFLDDIVKQILNGVNYLHNLEDPVIHRDLNLVNILLKKIENGIVVKIADFDISKVHENDKVNTLDQGTPKYMAPELSKENYNTKADIYSLGIIFKQLYHVDTDE